MSEAKADYQVFYKGGTFKNKQFATDAEAAEYGEQNKDVVEIKASRKGRTVYTAK